MNWKQMAVVVAVMALAALFNYTAFDYVASLFDNKQYGWLAATACSLLVALLIGFVGGRITGRLK